MANITWSAMNVHAGNVLLLVNTIAKITSKRRTAAPMIKAAKKYGVFLYKLIIQNMVTLNIFLFFQLFFGHILLETGVISAKLKCYNYCNILTF